MFDLLKSKKRRGAEEQGSDTENGEWRPENEDWRLDMQRSMGAGGEGEGGQRWVGKCVYALNRLTE